jgi:hypothetical protein
VIDKLLGALGKSFPDHQLCLFQYCSCRPPHLAGANVVRLKENVISLTVQNLPDLPKTGQLNPQFACCSHWASVGRDLHLNANISTPSPLLFRLGFYHSQQVCHAKSQRGYLAADLTKIALALETRYVV